MRGVDMGLLLERSGSGIDPAYRYSWRERRLEGWRQPELDADIFAPGEFPEDVELQLVLEDLPVPELVKDPDVPDLNPQIVFYASGETTPGYMELRERTTGEILWLVEWDLLGRFTLLPRGLPIDDEFDNE